jgi:superfamily II DNA or RNA helicase
MDTILTDRANIVVADEAHVLKNPHAKISYLSSKFRAKARIALTGSPLANNVEEYYSMINWVAPNFLGPLQEFRQIYAMPIHNGLWNDSTLYDKRKALKLLQALQDTVAPKVNRATIKTCLREGLPPKFEFVLSVRPTPKQREVYHLFINGVNSHNANSKSMEQGKVFNILNYLALICAHPTCFRTRLEEISRLEKAGKDTGSFPMSIHRHATLLTDEPRLEGEEFSHKVELLTAILDECKRMKDKVLVFSQSLPTIDYLMGLYNRQGRRISRLDGSTPISKRQDMIKDFNTGQEEVYLISTTAGGVGLNIHGANRVVIFDSKWNPVNDQQAVGRAYRIGQQKPVFVYKFVLAGTFEDDLQNKAVFKMQLASRIVDKKNPVSWSKQLRGLLHPIREVPSKDLSPFEGKDVVLDKLICCGKGDKIASIVSTDTFEEEDENWRLTAEERKEAENMVERNRLRISDPQAYERIMEREKLAAVSTQHQHGSFLPPGLPLLASQQDSIWNNSSPRPHLPSSGTPVSVASTRSGTSSPITLSANETPVPLPSRPPIPAPPTVSNLAVPAPMKGTNTYFASEKSRDEAAPPEDARELPKAPGSAEKTNPQAPKLSFGPFNKPSGKGTSGKGKFEEKFTECLQAQHHDLPTSVQEQSPEEFAKGIANQVETIRQEREFGFLPDNARWNLLCELLQNNRVVLAAAAGHLTAMFLAVAEENMLRDRVQAISKIPEEVFKSRMRQRGAEKDPEVWEAQQLQLLATQQQEDE